MKTLYLALILGLVFMYGTASASKNKKPSAKILSPDYINLQYAGNLGLGSVGLGYLSKNEKQNYGFSYGFLPSSVNSIEVHTVSAKGAINFRKHHLSKTAFLNAYVGTNLLYSFTNNTYLKFPAYYPSDYYFTNAIHLAPFLGIKFGSISTKKKQLTRYSYIELGTLDYYLINKIKYNRIRFEDCVNVCMGISVPLNKANNTPEL